jgi:hypothetical protein
MFLSSLYRYNARIITRIRYNENNNRFRFCIPVVRKIEHWTGEKFNLTLGSPWVLLIVLTQST